MHRAGRHAAIALVTAMAASGCASPGPVREAPQEVTPESRVSPPKGEWLGPRRLLVASHQDPATAVQALERWASGLEPIREPGRGDEIILVPKAKGGARHFVRWRSRDGALEIEFASREWLQGDGLRACCESLRYFLEANGVAVEDGPSGGVLLPANVLTPARNMRSILDEIMAGRGLVRIDSEAHMGAASVAYAPTTEGPTEWIVDWSEEIASDGSVEVFHVGTPFDGRGESEVIEELARRLSIRL